MTCVITAMEYVTQILKNTDFNYRLNFEGDYIFYINPNNENMDRNGVYANELESFLQLEFKIEQIYSQYSFCESIENGWPILSTISSDPTMPWDPVEHLIVIIGQTSDSNYYIYVDPSDGEYKTISYFNIKGNSYSVSGVNKY